MTPAPSVHLSHDCIILNCLTNRFFLCKINIIFFRPQNYYDVVLGPLVQCIKGLPQPLIDEFNNRRSLPDLTAPPEIDNNAEQYQEFEEEIRNIMLFCNIG